MMFRVAADCEDYRVARIFVLSSPLRVIGRRFVRCDYVMPPLLLRYAASSDHLERRNVPEERYTCRVGETERGTG